MVDEIEPAGKQTDYAKQQKNVKHQARVEETRKTGGTDISDQLHGPKGKGKK